MKNKKRKTIGKREIVYFMKLYLKTKQLDFNKETELTPIINSFIYIVNSFLERGFEINLRGFGSFLPKEINRERCIIGGKEYKIKKKIKVAFKRSNKPLLLSNK